MDIDGHPSHRRNLYHDRVLTMAVGVELGHGVMAWPWPRRLLFDPSRPDARDLSWFWGSWALTNHDKPMGCSVQECSDSSLKPSPNMGKLEKTNRLSATAPLTPGSHSSSEAYSFIY